MNPTTTPKTWTKTADRPLRSAWRSAGVWLLARFMGVPVPWQAVHQRDGRALLAYEHQRLLALGAAGEAVPPVLAFDGHSLVTGDIGTDLDMVIKRMGPAERLPLMCAASEDLARFHARGQWHGGAQARNMTWDGQRFARLDFEEPLYPAMPLELVQLYDALQLVMSLVRYLQPLGADAVESVLRAYREASAHAWTDASRSPPDLVRFVGALLPRLRRLLSLMTWVPWWRSSREQFRLRVMVEGMSAFVERTGVQVR